MKTLFLYIVKRDDDPILAGLTATEWLIRGAGEIPYRVIGSLEEATPTETDWFALLTGSTPLVTAEYLYDLVKECERRGVSGLEIGDGFLVGSAAYKEGFRPKRRASAPVARRVESASDAFRAEKGLYRRIAEISVQNGAIIPDMDSVRIDAMSLVESGAVVEPFALIEGSVIQSGARIGSFSEIYSSRIGRGATIRHAVVKDSTVGAGATIGPFAYIRESSVIGEGCRIGDFVEVKKSTLGAGVKAAHLAYVGDATVGEKTNVGCGTVFANYDGKTKHATTVGKRVFIGANTNLVAPLTVGDDAYIAAATTVTEDIPAGRFVIGRVRAEEKSKK